MYIGVLRSSVSSLGHTLGHKAARDWYFYWCYRMDLAGHYNEAREMEAASFHRSADWQSPGPVWIRGSVWARCTSLPLICIHLQLIVPCLCLKWARCSSAAISCHSTVHSHCVFLSAPLGAYVIALCWWEQPRLRVPSHTAIIPWKCTGKNRAKK